MDKPDLMSDALIPEFKSTKSKKLIDDDSDEHEQPRNVPQEPVTQNRIQFDGYKKKQKIK